MTDQIYLNFIGSEEESKIKAAYGDNYERLVALKNKYDSNKSISNESEY